MVFVQRGKDIAAEIQGLPPGNVSESEKGWQQLGKRDNENLIEIVIK